MDEWQFVLLALGSALLACLASYQLGVSVGYRSRWVPPLPKPNPARYVEPEIGEVDLSAEYLLESVTTNQIVAVEIATELSAVVLPELERQGRLTRRYRNEANREKRKQNGR